MSATPYIEVADLILYHADEDGYCAALTLQAAHPDAELIPVNYGQDPPRACDGKRVIIVDFSYKRAVLMALAGRCAELLVLDHHKTAEAELAGLPYCIFDTSKAGCRLAWEYLHGPESSPPMLVRYVEDRDLWRFALPMSKEINAAIRSYPRERAAWNELATKCEYNEGRLSLADEGTAILRYQRQVIDQHKRAAKLVLLAGHQVPCCNATTLFSDIAGELAEDAMEDANGKAPGHRFAFCWFVRQDGKVVLSFRSRCDFDVSTIAKALGGGGHKNAAGCEISLYELSSLLIGTDLLAVDRSIDPVTV